MSGDTGGSARGGCRCSAVRVLEGDGNLLVGGARAGAGCLPVPVLGAGAGVGCRYWCVAPGQVLGGCRCGRWVPALGCLSVRVLGVRGFWRGVGSVLGPGVPVPRCPPDLGAGRFCQGCAVSPQALVSAQARQCRGQGGVGVSRRWVTAGRECTRAPGGGGQGWPPAAGWGICGSEGAAPRGRGCLGRGRCRAGCRRVCGLGVGCQCHSRCRRTCHREREVPRACAGAVYVSPSVGTADICVTVTDRCCVAASGPAGCRRHRCGTRPCQAGAAARGRGPGCHRLPAPAEGLRQPGAGCSSRGCGSAAVLGPGTRGRACRSCAARAGHALGEPPAPRHAAPERGGVPGLTQLVASRDRAGCRAHWVSLPPPAMLGVPGCAQGWGGESGGCPKGCGGAVLGGWPGAGRGGD